MDFTFNNAKHSSPVGWFFRSCKSNQVTEELTCLGRINNKVVRIIPHSHEESKQVLTCAAQSSLRPAAATPLRSLRLMDIGLVDKLEWYWEPLQHLRVTLRRACSWGAGHLRINIETEVVTRLSDSSLPTRLAK